MGVCLPSSFHGGNFTFKHQGIEESCDWGKGMLTKPKRLLWCAFFGDVSHKIEKVYGGVRLTVSYILRRPLTTSKLAPALSSIEQGNVIREHLQAIVRDRAAWSKGVEL